MKEDECDRTIAQTQLCRAKNLHERITFQERKFQDNTKIRNKKKIAT